MDVNNNNKPQTGKERFWQAIGRQQPNQNKSNSIKPKGFKTLKGLGFDEQEVQDIMQNELKQNKYDKMSDAESHKAVSDKLYNQKFGSKIGQNIPTKEEFANINKDAFRNARISAEQRPDLANEDINKYKYFIKTIKGLDPEKTDTDELYSEYQKTYKDNPEFIKGFQTDGDLARSEEDVNDEINKILDTVKKQREITPINDKETIARLNQTEKEAQERLDRYYAKKDEQDANGKGNSYTKQVENYMNANKGKLNETQIQQLSAIAYRDQNYVDSFIKARPDLAKKLGLIK